MKIIVMADGFTLGGAEKQAYLLAVGLAAKGHTVELWAFEAADAAEPMKKLLESAGIRHRTLPSFEIWDWAELTGGKSVLRLGASCWRLFRKVFRYGGSLPSSDWDWIIPFTPRPSLFAAVYRARIGAKSVVWNHRGGYDAGGFPYTKLLKTFIRLRGPVLVANSHSGAKFLQDTFSKNANPNIISNICLPSRLAGMPGNGAENCIVHVANLYPEKDLETVLRAIAILNASGTSAHLKVIGRCPNRQLELHLRQVVADLGIGAAVTFLGPLANETVQEILSTTVVGCLSSRTEGCPNAILEYMDHGLAIVGSDIPGIRDILPEIQHPYLFAAGDASACAAALNALLVDRSLRARLGGENRKALEARFSASAIVDQWEAILHQRRAARRSRTFSGVRLN